MTWLRLRHWPFAVQLTLAPLLALCAMVGIAAVGGSRLSETVQVVDDLQRGGEAGRRLALIFQGVQEINGTLYRVLALQAAESKTLDAPVVLDQLVHRIDTVANQLTTWRDDYARPDQRPRIDALITAIKNYKVAGDWVRQMLDVDFASAVSFLQPFDEIYRQLNESLDVMVHDVAIEQARGSAEAHQSAAGTQKGFVVIAGGALMVVLADALALIVATLRSISGIADATLELAQGRLAVDLGALERRDELGAIVRSLGVFRDSLARVAELQAEQQAHEEAAETARKRGLSTLANDFEASVGTIAQVVGLANQTAQATQDISSHVKHIQGATREAVDAIGGVTETVEEVSTIATLIAQAVAQQGDSTAVIARNVQEMATSTQDLTSNISDVSRAANETGAAAENVLGSAEQLAGQAELLDHKVVAFLTNVRVA